MSTTDSKAAKPETNPRSKPNAAADVLFPLAGKKTDFTPEDIDRLLKNALMDKHADILAHKKSYHDEWAADAATFWRTIQSAVLLQPNLFYAGESAGAAGVIAYIKSQISQKEKEFKTVLNIWSKLDRDLKNPDISKQDAYDAAEDAMRQNGVAFEALDKFDLRHFSKNKFKALEKKYNETLIQKVQNTGRYLTRPPKTHLRLMRKNMPAKSKAGLEAVKEFAHGLVKNASNPHKLRTPKAVLSGMGSMFNIAGEWIKLKKEGFDPRQKQLHRLKDEYINNDIELEHWDRAIEIERAVGQNLRHAPKLGAAFSAATLFMILHGVEAANNAATGHYGEVGINLGSMIAGAGPLKELGHDLQRMWKKVNSDRSHLAEDYIRLHEDRAHIQKHENSTEGFRALTL